MDVLADAAAAAAPAANGSSGEQRGGEAATMPQQGLDAAVTLAAAFATSGREREDAIARAKQEAGGDCGSRVVADDGASQERKGREGRKGKGEGKKGASARCERPRRRRGDAGARCAHDRICSLEG